MSKRAAFYFDGFNIYHAIKDYNHEPYKWINLKNIAKNMASSLGHNVVIVKYFSALYKYDKDKVRRHEQYLKALELFGVQVIIGHYAEDSSKCHMCHVEYERRTEKETDINIALHATMDAVDNLYDSAYIVTTDGDQRPTCELIRKKLGKEVITVNTPGRSHNKWLIANSDGKINFTENHLKLNKLPTIIPYKGKNDEDLFVRIPEEYR